MTIFKTLAVLVFVTVLAFFGWTYKRWEGQAPQITFDRDLKAMGRNPALGLNVEDAGTGLKVVTIHLKQKGNDVVLLDESYGVPEPVKKYDIGKLIADHAKLEEGPASITVTASDASLRSFLKGNHSEATKDFVVDVTPPQLEILSDMHYINQGGSECVLYRVSADASVSGVQVGPNFFPGFPLSQSDPKVRFALFAFAYDISANSPVMIVAFDEAGNKSVAQPWTKVFPRTFRSRDIPLDDSFVQKAVPEILSHTPTMKDTGDPVKNFVEINSKLRRVNHDAIARFAKDSPGQFLWKGAFLQLSNSQVEAMFADRRRYVYQGKPVDQQDHVGFDLSVVQRYPIEAANDGKVILADYFGIYGNTVLIDHGAGLISLYGHMSSFDVKAGQMVKKKDTVGRSGATGLAAGDHLHFGLFLHGVPINPTEWWDEKWINDHVLRRFPPSGN
jgi:murein DD-endopeptidase MepM/ murein hydrolase activator NlpD